MMTSHHLLLLLLILPAAAAAAAAFKTTAAGLKLAKAAGLKSDDRNANTNRDQTTSASRRAAAAPYAPRSWYRFEDAGHPGKDEMGFHDLTRAGCHSVAATHFECGRNFSATTASVTPTSHTQSDGGVVGQYIQLDGSAAKENSSWLMNASVLPTQCASTYFTRGDGSYLGPTCPRNDKLLCGCTGKGGRTPAESHCSSAAAGHSCTRGITIEFLIRLGRNALRQGNLTLFESRDAHYSGHPGKTWIDLSRHGISFRAQGDEEGSGDDEEMIRPIFNGTGRASTSFLFDGEWHHLAFRRDTGGLDSPSEISIWIDGQNPQTGGPCTLGVNHKSSGPLMCWQATGTHSGFMNNLTCAGMGCGQDVRSPLLILPTVFDGAIDEIALHEHPLPDAVIYAHYKQAILKHTPYMFDGATLPPAPPPSPIHGDYDKEEYAPGTVLPSPSTGNPVTQGVNVSPLQQLQSWPAPRYHAPPMAVGDSRNASSVPAELVPLSVSWIADYLAGGNQPRSPTGTFLNPNRTQSMAVTTSIEEIAAMVFGYSFYTPLPGNCLYPSDTNCSINVAKPSENKTRYLLTKYPKIMWEISELRDLQINQSLPDSCYLTNNRSEFIDPTGKPVAAGGKRTMRPLLAATAEKVGCPYALWNVDAQLQNQGLKVAKGVFGRGVTRLWDDAEYTYIKGSIQTYGPLDPVIIEAYEASKIPDWPDGTRDWEKYFSRWYGQ